MSKPQMISLRSGYVQIPYSFLPFTFQFHVMMSENSLLSVLDSENATILDIRFENNGTLSLDASSGSHARQFSSGTSSFKNQI